MLLCIVFLYASILTFCWFSVIETVSSENFIGLTRGSRSLMYIFYTYMNNWLKSPWEFYCSICDMTVELSYYKRGSIFNIRISRENLKIFYTWVLYFIVQIFCIRFNKTDFILAIVAQVSDVTHRRLILLHIQV